MALVDEFVVSFDVWEEAKPYLRLMVDEREMRVVIALKDRQVPVGQAADLLEMADKEAAELLRDCYSRYIVDRTLENGAPTYSSGSFHAFMDYFAKYENWDDVPVEGRRATDQRFLNEFIDKHRSNVGRKMRGLETENLLPNDTVLLLPEVEEMLEAAQHIVVQPCDCRRLGQHCERPVETCIWLDEGALESLERGHGRRLTTDEALDLVRWADKKGLMHTADSEWRERGLQAICNCCACDCYPFRAAQELGSKGAWPRSRYVAVYDEAQCNLCGACVQRCHFGAFYHDGSMLEVEGKARQQVRYEPDK